VTRPANVTRDAVFETLSRKNVRAVEQKRNVFILSTRVRCSRSLRKPALAKNQVHYKAV